MSEENEPKATMGQVKALIRRRLRKHPEHEEHSLNIYPLMDVMTILLVFMIMQFAQESANIVQDDSLQIPYSTATTTPLQALPIQISRTEIVVDGRRVLTLRNGQVDPSQKQGGGAGFLITPLHSVLTQHRDRLRQIAAHNPSRPFTGEVQIIADKRTSFRTLSEVIYTLGQSEFSNLHFVVLQTSPRR
ncbi:MAG: biopolymer transporter ExbD [Sandaracinaceae bacterium]|nr:biopolymer transporter ExbD [Sandaracinaceae bacterium]